MSDPSPRPVTPSPEPLNRWRWSQGGMVRDTTGEFVHADLALPSAPDHGLRKALPPIVLFDIDGAILGIDGSPLPGAPALIDTLMCLGYEVHFWSAGGTLHVADALQRAAIYGAFTTHDKPTYPPTEDAALRIIGRRPALQIDDDPTERVADWPFMIWPGAVLSEATPSSEPALDVDVLAAPATPGLERAYEDLQERYLAATAIRQAVSDEPWSFKEGTLLERLEWCRWQHQVAAEARLPVPQRSVEENIAWHWACVRWYDQMVRDLPRLSASQPPEPDIQ